MLTEPRTANFLFSYPSTTIIMTYFLEFQNRKLPTDCLNNYCMNLSWYCRQSNNGKSLETCLCSSRWCNRNMNSTNSSIHRSMTLSNNQNVQVALNCQQYFNAIGSILCIKLYYLLLIFSSLCTVSKFCKFSC